MSTRFRVSVWQDNIQVAAVEGSTASAVLREAAVYAAQYERDGPIVIKIKNPKEPRT